MSYLHTSKQALPQTPGFICVLHTFGRDLKWNPHTFFNVTFSTLSCYDTMTKKTGGLLSSLAVVIYFLCLLF